MDDLDRVLQILADTGYTEDRFFIHCDGALFGLMVSGIAGMCFGQSGGPSDVRRCHEAWHLNCAQQCLRPPAELRTASCAGSARACVSVKAPLTGDFLNDQAQCACLPADPLCEGGAHGDIQEAHWLGVGQRPQVCGRAGALWRGHHAHALRHGAVQVCKCLDRHYQYDHTFEDGAWSSAACRQVATTSINQPHLLPIM